MIYQQRTASIRWRGVATGALCAIFSASTVVAGPGRLSNFPLYVGEGVKPNLLYVVDDSGSMAFHILKSRAAEAAYPAPDRYRQETYALSYWNEYIINYEKEDPRTKEDILRVCHGYNVLAYNPNVTYKPWAGNDREGNPFTDADFHSARLDPRWSNSETVTFITGPSFNAAGEVGQTEVSVRNAVDLANHKYMPWRDSAAPGTVIGEFDAGECNENPIDAGTDLQSDSTLAALVGFTLNVSEDASASDVASAQALLARQKTNYANWFTYYRSRSYAMKAALTNVLAQSSQRVGLATINGNDYQATPVSDLANPLNRANLLNNARNIGASGGTPLEQALDYAGKYFAGIPVASAEGEDFDPLFPANTPSPILSLDAGGACQQNFTILMTDGFSNARPVSIGDLDNDQESGHLGDIAKYYYDNDLSPLPDRVSSGNTRDQADHQHMVTYAVAFGVEGNFSYEQHMAEALARARASGTDLQSELENGPWPNPIEGKSEDTIDDLFHATVNGRGKFFSSSNPEELLSDLLSVENSIADDAQGTAASVGFNSTNIEADTYLFQGWFDTSSWQGDLKAFRFVDGDAPDESDLEWSAADLLAERVALNVSAPERQIITYNGEQGVPFAAPPGQNYREISSNTLGETQLRDLLANAPFPYLTGVPEQQRSNSTFLGSMVRHLRGDVSTDGVSLYGFTFRDRNDGIVLGDIVHSSPVYVGAPSAPYPENIETLGYYASFAGVDRYRQRMPVVYVGANDGMLHAFKATSRSTGGGTELFAYIPGALFSSEPGRGLHHLASASYENQHRPYVDGTPTSADVYVNGEWRTYLVGGFSAGGKGVYVLDITNPSEFGEANAANMVITEFTHANLGYTFARPQIAKLNNGEWAAIFGNGYNNNGSYQSSLFILYLDGHEGASGPSFREISTGVGTSDDCRLMNSGCNGLSSPTILDITGDTVVDRVYAGDIQGNMWAFDLSAEQPSAWGVAHHGSGRSAPLFSACRSRFSRGGQCPADDRQSITVKPLVVAHPSQRSVATDPNLLVIFGSGQYVAEGDSEDGAISSRTQSLFGVWDSGAAGGERQFQDLVEQSITTETQGARAGTRTVSDNPVEYSLSSMPEVYGWRASLGTKERLIVNPTKSGDFAIFATTIPSDAMCEAGGRGYLMAVNLVDGSQPRYNVFPNRPEGTSGLELPAGPGGVQILDDNIVVPDTHGGITSEEFVAAQPRPSRRSSWSIIK